MRLIFSLLVLVLSAWSLVASAASPVLVPPDMSANMANCQANLSAWGYDEKGTALATNCRVETWESGGRQKYQVRYTAQGTWQPVGDPVVAEEKCAPVPPSTSYTYPDTSKPRDQQCPDPPETCVAPLVDDGAGKCVDPCAKNKGKSSGKGHYDVGTNPKIYASACQGSCTVLWVGDDVGFTRLQSGVRHYYAYGEYVQDGYSCTASDTHPDVPMSASAKSGDGKPAANSDGSNPGPCGPGETPGTVNNKPVCLKKDTTSGITFVTPSSNPNNAVGQSTGTVTTGDNTSPAEGSYENYCRSHGTITICSGTAFDSASGTSGTGSSTGSGEGETSSGTGTGSSGSGTGTGTGTVNCPGCATEATLASIKGILNPAGVNPGGAVDGAGKADDGFKPAGDLFEAMKTGNGPFTSLSWDFGGLFPSSAQCSPIQINVLKQQSSIDVCSWVELVRAVLGWICYVLTAIGIYRIATGQKSQGDAA